MSWSGGSCEAPPSSAASSGVSPSVTDRGEAAVPAVSDSEGVGNGVARVEDAPLVHERHPFGPADRALGQVAVPRDPLSTEVKMPPSPTMSSVVTLIRKPSSVGA